VVKRPLSARLPAGGVSVATPGIPLVCKRRADALALTLMSFLALNAVSLSLIVQSRCRR
jgi:hypothetical protein